ncbi:lysozyme inhibitor LprI family protein [Methylobacterium haplocladii]|uniref:Lysozyme inhibitor LprI-like N-terminal domain-containing protein n=1 Tax=Methylobacterium haplocladii TaxID=1176176 RepID=A0A512IUK2_9HYPH|nr:lysozyme inhibitor LprI family protein [Methylobacterium haplocladii]GEP01377.1 hypothetical protein MHA02_37640 [Methylobacterium haplocladii]GJD83821.1 hypothetical protein HPGCJGGD_1694 [Methylobacterium haplocladii]GLS58268.1 hypothetical protein GCM10007887_09260 [Methylobacterium haplocladii]
MRSFLVPLLIAAAPLGPPAIAAEWGDDTRAFTSGYERSKAICRSAKSARLPEVAAVAAPDCDAEALYYGIGRKADPVTAHACALRQAARQAPDADSPFEGRSLLMTIYANGLGAPRDLDLAIALACRIDGAPAEIDGRVLHLDRLRAEHWAGRDFDICDDLTSGYMMGLCASHGARLEAARRDADVARLTAAWPPQRKAAFAHLRTTADTYAEAVSENEVDPRGSGSGAFQVEAKAQQQSAFVGLLQQLAAGRSPDGTSSFADADAALNRAYGKLMKAKDDPDALPHGKDGIRRTQRAWLVYPDAFAAFAREAFPATDRDALLAALTKARTKALAAGAD